MNQFKKLAGQTAIYGIGSVVPRILNYILLTPFYTRVLPTVVDYGTHTYLYSYSAFLIILLTFGMETTFFRYAKKRGIEKVYSASFVFLLFNSIIFSCLIFSSDTAIAAFIGNPKVEYIWYFIGIITLDVISTIPFATLRYLEKAKLFATLKLLSVVINIIVNLFYLWLIPLLQKNTSIDFSSIYDPSRLLEYTFRANLIANFFTFLFLIPHTWRFYKLFDISLLKEMIIYSFPIMLSGLMGMINEVADKILLNFMLPKDVNAMQQIGVYSANYKIGMLLSIFNSMFRFGLEPFFFKISDNSDSKSNYAIITKYYLYFGLLILLGVTLFINYFKYFISSNYYDGLHIVPIVLLAHLFFGLYYTLSVWYKVTDKTYFSAIFALVGALVTLLINIILIPIMGYTGSAIATLLCYFSMLILTIYYGQIHYYIKYEFKAMFSVFGFAVLIFVFGKVIRFDNEIINFLYNSVLIVAYLIFVIFSNKEILNKLKSYGNR
ncbi:MAG: polysaccharide biosynthesis C-terminal domain-containing protein [Salinivirgaceae bacterium]|nr:polysaccharide biosynthesis C-terminal domain-containing protein [Salinivirgaceae bacterium]MDD4746060.1 polysaccharide biosynthesis C-terminal domain-containing protein [Salinivirgaceae bacterium]